MSEIYHVKNLHEALILANKFKSSGKYNLFRGQACDWPVISTKGRLDKEQLTEESDKLMRFFSYLKTIPTLKRFAKDIDWFFAIAQHYGLPTNYIDFSSNVEVAAFFATHSESNKINENCSIICLNEEDFNNSIKRTSVLYKDVIAPYIVRVNVDNLWRLQAQHGCFLFSPYVDIEQLYDFDKILFPFNESFDGLKKQNIYPERKSELEILLDHYFNAEARLAGQRRMKAFAEKLGVKITTLGPLDCSASLKRNAIHPSWTSKNLAKWLYFIKEEWKEHESSNTVKLRIDFELDIEERTKSIANTLIQFIERNKVERTSPLEFKISAKPRLKLKQTKLLNTNCARVWDGMRSLPYKDNDIVNIIASYIALESSKDEKGNIVFLSNKDLITLELTNEYGSITRCLASPDKIVECFRNDLKDIVIDELLNNVTSEILLHINIPNLIFDFDRLTQLFKEELILYQVLHNSEAKNPVIFYTPAQITILGYA